MIKYYRSLLFLIFFFTSLTLSAQESIKQTYINAFYNIFDIKINQFPDKEFLHVVYNTNYKDRGIIDTVRGDMLHLYDEFDEYHLIIPSKETLSKTQGNNDFDFKFLLVAGSYSDISFDGIFTLTFEIPMDTVKINSGSNTFLVDDERFKYNFNLRKSTVDSALLNVSTTDQAFWASLGSSNNARLRIDGNVISIDNIIKKQINNTVEILNSNLPKTIDKEELNQTYVISWDTNLPRRPIKQVMPANVLNIDGSLTVQFEINPNGTIGIIKRLHDMKPEFEAEILRALRGWRFDKLPIEMKQTAQSGSITFYFVSE